MDQDVDFDWPWWSIETLLQWIGMDEEKVLVEIHRNAEHLDFTGERGPLAPRFGKLKPRAGIPDIDFAAGCFLNLDGCYVYVPSYPNETMPEGWEHLRLRAANAKAIWPPPSNVSKARIVGDDGQTKSPQGDQLASFRPSNPDEQCSPTSAPISGALMTGAIQSPEPEEILSPTTAETTETENADIAKASSEVAIATPSQESEQRSARTRVAYRGHLSAYMARTDTKMLRRMGSKDIAKRYIDYHKDQEKQGKSVPKLPHPSNWVIRIAVQVEQILREREERDEKQAPSSVA